MAGLIVNNVVYLDPESGELRPNTSVRIENDRVVEVKDGSLTAAANDVVVIDGGGRTMLPGLIDAHVHAGITTMDLKARATRSSTRIGIEAKNILERMLRRGFTTVRDAGGMDIGLGEALELGLIDGPRAFRSGRVISQTGGHGDITPSSDNPATVRMRHQDNDVQSRRRRARRRPPSRPRGAQERGPSDQGDVRRRSGHPTDAIDMIQCTEPEIRAAVVEASNRNTYAMAHAYMPEAITQAVNAGVRSIEHGCLIDEASAQLVAQHGTYLVPTLVVYQQLNEFGRALNFPAESMAKLDFVLNASNKAVETALKAGVKMGSAPTSSARPTTPNPMSSPCAVPYSRRSTSSAPPRSSTPRSSAAPMISAR